MASQAKKLEPIHHGALKTYFNMNKTSQSAPQMAALTQDENEAHKKQRMSKANYLKTGVNASLVLVFWCFFGVWVLRF